jgi:hypothetical protein
MNNLILIGMPGVGKSTVGVIVAKLLGFEFVDTDLLIQTQEKKRLYEIISDIGAAGFIELENQILSVLKTERTVIATGGSVVYGKEAMQNLKALGTVIYIRLDIKSLKVRLGNIKNRGVVNPAGKSLEDLYQERIPLYEKYADIIIDEQGCDIEKTVEKIVTAINE